MRSFLGRTTTLGICAVAGLLWSGCEGKPATEYVTGISTQVKVPRDIKAVRLQVSVGGVNQFCQGYQVYNGVVQLPRSLGTYANSASALSGAPITYTVIGVAEKDVNADFFATCAAVNIGQSQARVLRRSTQPYIPDEIRYIPMPLKYSCFDKQCGEDDTCKAGRCVPASLSKEQASALFPKYDPGLVDGSSGGCFDAKSCMAVALPALVVDRDKCIYAVANSPGAPATVDPKVNPLPPLPPNTPWEGTNVEVVYDGGLNLEVLDLEPEEGFSIPDPAKPQQFQLAPGLCEMVKGVDVNAAGKDVGETCTSSKDCKSDACRDVPVAGHPEQVEQRCVSRPRITAVRASGTCQSKRMAQPFCLADQYAQMGVDDGGGAPNDANESCTTIELKPPKSALMVVVDGTQGNANFFDPSQIDAVDVPLSDPAFSQTDIGLLFAPLSGDACATSAPPALPLEPAIQASAAIREKLKATASSLGGGEPQFEGALQSAYALLRDPGKTFYKRAVLVVGNRGGDLETCGGITGSPSEQVADALSQADPTKKISTYVIQFVNAPGQTNADPLELGLAQLASKGSAEGQAGSYDPDARGSKRANAKLSFQKIINSLTTCVYDVPVSVAPADGDVVSFSNPLDGSTTSVDFAAGCNGEGVGAEGWGFGDSPDPAKKRVYLCKSSCEAYQTVLGQVSSFALAYGIPSLAVPVFAHAKACNTKP
jgi:hypothetical protein